MTTGEPLRVRAAMKPISTVPRALATVDVATGEPAKAINQRSDVCAVPAAGVVAEAMVALVLADAVLEKFGGDSVAETRRNSRATSTTCSWHPSAARTACVRARRPAWVRARRTVGRLLAERLGVALPRHRRRRRGGRTGRPIADIFVDDGEAALPRAGAAGGRRGARPSTTACSRSAAARCSTRTPASCWPAHAGGLPRRSASPTPCRRVGLDARRPLLLGNPRGQWLRADGRARARSTRRSPTVTVLDRRPRRRPSVADEIVADWRCSA